MVTSGTAIANIFANCELMGMMYGKIGRLDLFKSRDLCWLGLAWPTKFL